MYKDNFNLTKYLDLFNSYYGKYDDIAADNNAYMWCAENCTVMFMSTQDNLDENYWFIRFSRPVTDEVSRKGADKDFEWKIKEHFDKHYLENTSKEEMMKTINDFLGDENGN